MGSSFIVVSDEVYWIFVSLRLYLEVQTFVLEAPYLAIERQKGRINCQHHNCNSCKYSCQFLNFCKGKKKHNKMHSNQLLNPNGFMETCDPVQAFQCPPVHVFHYFL